MSGPYGMAYFDQNPEALGRLELPASIAEAWKAHWAGTMEEALESYRGGDLSTCDREVREVAAADIFLLKVKLGRYPPAVPTFCGKSPYAAFIHHYAVFTWFFWFDQRRSWKALFRMALAALKMLRRPAMGMVVFLIFHMITISGHRKWGFQVAKKLYGKARNVFSSGQREQYFFYRVAISSFAYTCLAAGSSADAEGDVLAFGDRYVGDDGYYRTVFDACAMYNASYTGDIIRAQIHSEKLRRYTEASRVSRYAVLADVMELLPYALQGYSRLVSRRLAEVERRQGDCAEPLVRGQFLRVSALIELHRGNMEKAIALAREASEWTKKLGVKVFWEAIDLRIQAIASKGVEFDPRRDQVVPFKSLAKQPPHLSEAILDLVLICSQSPHEDDDEIFVHRVAEVLARHVRASKTPVVHVGVPARLGTNPVFRILDRTVEFDGVEAERSILVRDQLSLLSPLLLGLVHLRGAQNTARESAKAMAALKLAEQVAHDIRSPLAALKTVTQTWQTDNEERDIVRIAVSRIEDVANDLLDRRRALAAKPRTVVCVDQFIDSLLAEKRLEYSQRAEVNFVKRSEEVNGECLVKVNEKAARRAFSNLINNSVEALSKGGTVEVIVKAESTTVFIDIHDDGQGIPEDVLKRIRCESFTHGKKNGNGLGLAYARQTFEEQGGTLQIQSCSGNGTTVNLALPRYFACSPM